MKLKEDVKPIAYLKNNADQLVRDVADKGRTVTITQKGEAKAVLMDVGTYDRWQQALSLMKILAQSEAELASNKVISQDEAFRRAALAIERPAENE
jgi:prevent-host-death family protein